jgi:hypothetical protein
MKIYPIDYELKDDTTTAPTKSDPVAVAKVRAAVKAEVARLGKPADADHYVAMLASRGLLSGIVDIYAILADGKTDWQVPVAAVEPELVAVEK